MMVAHGHITAFRAALYVAAQLLASSLACILLRILYHDISMHRDNECANIMPIYQTRWSAKRLWEIVNAIKGKKRDVISKSSFRDLLYLSSFVLPPEDLLDIIVMRIDTNKHVFKRPLEFGKRGKAGLREVYLDGKRAPIPSIVVVLSKVDEEEEETIKSHGLYCA
ncbi:putative aquaporin TIP4-1 [Hordeum vulgare]|nr:putative aquaporin TIP4-1 [Hordeum vulgare]